MSNAKKISLRPTKPRDTDPDDVSDGDEAKGRSLTAGRVHVDVTIPRTTVTAKMRIVTRAEVSAIRAETRRFLVEAGFPVDLANLTAFGALDEWNSEIAVRHLAIAVRNPEDVEEALSDLDSWRDCDDDQIAALWNDYQDLERRLNPFGNAATLKLDESTTAAIREATRKRDAEILMSYGSPVLAAYMIAAGAAAAPSPASPPA